MPNKLNVYFCVIFTGWCMPIGLSHRLLCDYRILLKNSPIAFSAREAECHHWRSNPVTQLNRNYD